MEAALAQWIQLRQPFIGPGFDSYAQKLNFFQFIFELWFKKER